MTGHLTLIQSIILVMAPLIGYMALDLNQQAFRVVYVGSIFIALIGAVALSRVRLRGERELLRYERTPEARPRPHGTPAAIYEFDPEADSGFWAVLRRDPFFRKYMLWQFVAGMGMMMGETVILFMITEMTDGLRWKYLASITLSIAVPTVLQIVALPLWARRLDHVHVARFRAEQSWLWIVDQSGNFVVAVLALGLGGWWSAPMAAALIVCGLVRLVQGVLRGAGTLAWNLGHNDFADRRMVAQYMGVHVTLTGIRGVIVPFMGMLLYNGWRECHIPLLDMQLPAWNGLKACTFLVTLSFSVVATFGFSRLARSVGGKPTTGA